jgi:hypothetical protein
MATTAPMRAKAKVITEISARSRGVGQDGRRRLDRGQGFEREQ